MPIVILSVVPANGALGHVQNDSIVITFDGPAAVGTSNVIIREADQAGVFTTKTTIDVVTDQGTGPGQVTFAGSTLTIYPETQAVMRKFAIRIDPTAVVGFAGVADDTTLVHVTNTGVVLPSIDPVDYTNTFVDQTFTTIRSLDGAGDDDTLYLRCTVEDTSGNAFDIRNVNNVTIAECIIRRIGGDGIRLRSTGSTSNVSLVNNVLSDIDGNGITSGKRHATSIDHTDLLVHNNSITNSGLTGNSGSRHGIYIQATDSVISQNSVLGTVDGNGISYRCASVLYGNIVDCTSVNDTNASAIKYFGDHVAGPISSPRTDDQTIACFNSIDGNSDLKTGIEGKKDATEGSYTDEEWNVNIFDVYGNDITGITTDDIDFATMKDLSYCVVTLDGVVL